MKSITLFRPVGVRDLALLRDSGFRRWPSRLAEQPIFYPETNEAYAAQMARDWNTKDDLNGARGYGVQFRVASRFLERFEKRVVGGSEHEEYWIPAEDLEALNDAIVGTIDVIRAFSPDGECAVDAIPM